MTDIKYRKLTDTELTTLGPALVARFAQGQQTTLQKQIVKHVQEYYPASAHSASLSISSVYNDEGYDCRPGYLVVYDENQEEVPPLKTTARQCREQWQNFDVPDSTSDDEPADVVVLMPGRKIPDLYIKTI